jgi:predicted nucleotidyltransferase
MNEELDNFVNSLAGDLKPSKIFLFGSRAWGTANLDSDYDLMVIVDSEKESLRMEAARVLNLYHPGKISIDLMIKSSKYIQNMISIGDPFTKKILDRGKLLYERSN